MISIYKLEFTVLQQEILRFLFVRAGEAFTARQLALPLDVSPPAVAKALPLLERKGFVRVAKDRASKRLSISLNRESPLVIGLKRADNVRQLYESGLAEFLRERFPACAVTVFGSFAKGEDMRASDIDVAIVGASPRPLDLSAFDQRIGNPSRGNTKEEDAPGVPLLEDWWDRAIAA